jgi:hypothetical protein
MSEALLVKQMDTSTIQAILRNSEHGSKQLRYWPQFPEILLIVCPREGNITSVTKEKKKYSIQ